MSGEQNYSRDLCNVHFEEETVSPKIINFLHVDFPPDTRYLACTRTTNAPPTGGVLCCVHEKNEFEDLPCKVERCIAYLVYFSVSV